jgi:hypothetical protein
LTGAWGTPFLFIFRPVSGPFFFLRFFPFFSLAFEPRQRGLQDPSKRRPPTFLEKFLSALFHNFFIPYYFRPFIPLDARFYFRIFSGKTKERRIDWRIPSTKIRDDDSPRAV